MAQNSKLILAPPTVQVRIELEPVLNVLDSFVMLNLVEEYTGLGGWVTRTFSALTPEERQQNKLLLGWFEKALLPQLHMPSFPAYLDHLSKEEPATLIERTLRKQAEHHQSGHFYGRKFSRRCFLRALCDSVRGFPARVPDDQHAKTATPDRVFINRICALLFLLPG